MPTVAPISVNRPVVAEAVDASSARSPSIGYAADEAGGAPHSSSLSA